ncbi:hypothetical protein [Mycolicibacterium poriferae]|uniref:hypothetical protein n=1 Tax=Mycolicibacterium poriferae TaxID=39694 RepID=UPI0024BB9E9D|nr:hypothetical protein [Mycolicibacterium poriferae]
MRDGVGRQPLSAADDLDEFGDHPLGQRDVGGLTGQRDGVAADMDVGGQQPLESTQVFVGGPQQAHDQIGRNCHAAPD